MEVGTVICLTSAARAGWFEILTARCGRGGMWILPEGTRLQYAGFRNSPPIGADPLPVAHFMVLTGEHASHLVDQIGKWEYDIQNDADSHGDDEP